MKEHSLRSFELGYFFIQEFREIGCFWFRIFIEPTNKVKLQSGVGSTHRKC